jgi:2-deoxy-D-gluconate 3-dehydrogenase
VTLVSRRADVLKDVERELLACQGAARALACDLANLEGLAELADRLDELAPVDGVVHASGLQVRRDALDFTIEEWQSVQRINLDAPYFLSREIARRQLSRGEGGSHVMIASLGSSIALPRAAAYTASKAGLMGVVRTLAAEWAEHGIRVNAVAPGYIYTDLTADLLDQPAQRERILGRIPMRRLGQPHDIGPAVVFLLSQASNYVTGEILQVDGGWLAS